MNHDGYVLITPARNEEAYIEQTIRSVIAQTVLPRKWVIVSDGSTDRTDAIVAAYCARHDFMQLVSSRGDAQRNFGSKVQAFAAGYAVLEDMPYGYLGNLDADVSFDPDYFASVLQAFARDHTLGIAGGIIQELINGRYVTQIVNLNRVAGAVHLFRRACYEAVGGYIPLEYGGIDAAAEIMARAKGFRVRTLPELKVTHHRRVGFSSRSKLAKRFMRWGRMHYSLGYHPAYYVCLCGYKMFQRPYFFHGMLIMLGYLSAWIEQEKRAVPDEFIRHLRHEQLHKLFPVFKRERRYRCRTKGKRQ